MVNNPYQSLNAATTDGFKREYFSRIHRAQDFIEENLGRMLFLEEIAQAACFSPYHFHRLYTAMTGESIYQFVLRLRLERAASRLCRQPPEPVTTIAFDLGFSSSVTFARAFKGFFGVSASEYRGAVLRKIYSKNRKTIGKDGKANIEATAYSEHVDNDIIKRSPEMKAEVSSVQPQNIEVKETSAKSLAYVRHLGPYAGDGGLFERLFGRIFAWAGPRGLFRPPQTEMIIVYHDDPAITTPEKLRTSVGLTVPPDTQVSGEVSLLEIPAGPYVCALFEIFPSEYEAAWNTVFADWMPRSGWQPGDGPCYECMQGDPKQHPEGKHLVEIRVSVKPL